MGVFFRNEGKDKRHDTVFLRRESILQAFRVRTNGLRVFANEDVDILF